ncbi:MAG: YabP/YqfC family sporulation protein [Oscillospiraceae bacterium]
MPQQEKREIPHSLILEKKEKLKATGVLDVEGFDENSVSAMLSDSMMTVKGRRLKVIGFSEESGELSVEGEIDSVSYQAKLSRKAGILARVFK